MGYRPGARFAPNALREASGRYAPGSEGYFDLETETYRLRGLRTNLEAYRAARARGHTLVTAARVREDLPWVLEQLPQGQKVYLSFDVDVLDPSIMPGTSSPEVEGLTYAEALAVVRRTITRNELVGFDLVELAPNWDSSGLSSLVGARLLAEV